MKGIACALRSTKNEMIVVIKKKYFTKSVDIISVKMYYKIKKKLRGLNMKEKMIQYFEGCGFTRAEAEKETAIHVREIQRRELPDRITEEQACNYFMMDLIFE